MGKYKTIFSRFEKKYIITLEQKEALLNQVQKYIQPDEYGKSVVSNIYFDTPDFRLIRASLEKPVYKEKLRLRTYGTVSENSPAFVELKKKYKGIVYKRRIDMTYKKAINFLLAKKVPENCDKQIADEILYTLNYYPNLGPKVSLFYDRIAFISNEDSDLRLTFDSNIRFRNKNLDLVKGSAGEQILKANKCILEIKFIGSMPLWLTNALTQFEIYPGSFSKYGNAYRILTGQIEADKTANVLK